MEKKLIINEKSNQEVVFIVLLLTPTTVGAFCTCVLGVF